LHGIGAREPWSYSAEAEAAVTQALKLRYQLLPTINQAVTSASATGLPVQRAMVLACPDERAAWGFEEQFMLGDSMLVAPCLQPGGEVEVYLPATISNQWRRFPSGDIFAGGCSHKLRLSLDEMAAFVPADNRISLGPDRQFIEDNDKEPPVVSLWPQ
jgi:alpha-D-xyloside xylohydrolase